MRQRLAGFWAVYRKEMGHYLVSPVAYAVIGAFLLAAGFLFYFILSGVMQQAMQAGMQAMRFGGPAEFDVPGIVMRNFFGLLATLALFLMPMLTMGLYAEERKRGTIELLMTSPVRELEIVLGKYFAALSLYALMLAPTLLYHLVLFLKSEPLPSWRLLAVGYLGALLLGAALVALGSFLSTLTESQLVAAVLTFGLFLLLWVIDIGGRGAGTVTGQVLEYLSILRHYEDFTRGVVDTSSLVYYASLIVLGLFGTLRALDSMRWRAA
jgi:ABC-2 type transport system permease protein